VIKSICLLLLIINVANATQIKVPAGTVIVSRNRLLRDNKTPGYWNHLGIITKDGFVIEAQQQVGVVKTPLKVFLARDYSEIQVLVPKDRLEGARAAAKCETLVGKPYRGLSSLFRYDTERRQQIGLNCVSTVRLGFVDEHWCWHTLHLPDGVFRFVDSDFERPVIVRTAR